LESSSHDKLTICITDSFIMVKHMKTNTYEKKISFCLQTEKLSFRNITYVSRKMYLYQTI